MERVNNFDVLKKMSADNLDLRIGVEIIQARKTKRGTQVTIGIGGDVVTQIFNGKLVGCLLLWDPVEFAKTKKKLEAK